MLELGYLRELVADKEKAVKAKIEDIRLANFVRPKFLAENAFKC